MVGKEVGYLTVASAAQYCEMHENTIRKAIHANELKHLKLGKSYRIRTEWVDEWLEAWADATERALRSA